MSQLPDFQQCLVIVNNASTQAARSLRQAKELSQHIADCQIVQVEPADLDNARFLRQYADTLGQHTLLVVGGGDGTVSRLVNLLLQDKQLPAEARQTVILPLWGGNANDLAHMLNGHSREHLGGLLKRAQLVSVHPLSAQLSIGSETHDRLAVCYISFGAVAWVAEKMNRPGHRRKWFYRLPGSRTTTEIGGALQALNESKRFRANVDGQDLTLYDLTLVNGPQIAKFYRLPVRLDDKHFLELRLPHKHPVFLVHIFKVTRAWLGRRTKRTGCRVSLQEPAWIQFDGETWQAPAGTDISIEIAPHAVRFLTTR